MAFNDINITIGANDRMSEAVRRSTESLRAMREEFERLASSARSMPEVRLPAAGGPASMVAGGLPGGGAFTDADGAQESLLARLNSAPDRLLRSRLGGAAGIAGMLYGLKEAAEEVDRAVTDIAINGKELDEVLPWLKDLPSAAEAAHDALAKIPGIGDVGHALAVLTSTSYREYEKALADINQQHSEFEAGLDAVAANAKAATEHIASAAKVAQEWARMRAEASGDVEAPFRLQRARIDDEARKALESVEHLAPEQRHAAEAAIEQERATRIQMLEMERDKAAQEFTKRNERVIEATQVVEERAAQIRERIREEELSRVDQHAAQVAAIRREAEEAAAEAIRRAHEQADTASVPSIAQARIDAAEEEAAAIRALARERIESMEQQLQQREIERQLAAEREAEATRERALEEQARKARERDRNRFRGPGPVVVDRFGGRVIEGLDFALPPAGGGRGGGGGGDASPEAQAVKDTAAGVKVSNDLQKQMLDRLDTITRAGVVLVGVDF